MYEDAKYFIRAIIALCPQDKAVERREIVEMKIEPVIRPVLRENRGLFNANKIASLRHFDTYLSIYFYPDRRFRYDGRIGSSLLSNALSLGRKLSPSLGNRARLMSRVPPCESLNEATRGKKKKKRKIRLTARASLAVEISILKLMKNAK